jgi:hypothetical protein
LQQDIFSLELNSFIREKQPLIRAERQINKCCRRMFIKGGSWTILKTASTAHAQNTALSRIERTRKMKKKNEFRVSTDVVIDHLSQ